MSIGDFGAVLNDIEVLFDRGTTAGLTDVQLLDRFLADGGASGEAAFTAVVKRHGPMVLRVCRGELQELHAAEDAFQATFLILARQARSIRESGSLSSWLYGVARRVARRARTDAARRAARERRGGRMIEDRARHAPEPPDLVPEVQEEVDRLPEKYRSPIVLCYLEGLTHEEAAFQLRVPVGTLKIRLSRGRERLRGRLIRRGLAPALIASALAAPTRAAVPAPLVDITVKAAMRIVALHAAGASATVAGLVEGVLRAMLINKLKTITAVVAASMTLIVTTLIVASGISTPVRSEQEPGQADIRRPAPKPENATRNAADHPVEVAVVTVKKSAFQHTTAQPGTVEPWQKVDVFSRVSGYLGRIAVDIGSAVKRGDVLAEIVAPELALDQARARVLVQQAKAHILTTKSRVQVAESAVKTALASLASSEAALKAAEATTIYRKKQLERIRALVQRGAVEKRLLEEEEDRSRAAEAEAFAAKVQVTVTKAAVEEARAKLDSAMADLGEIEEGLHLADVELERAGMMRDSARIRSPIDGFVTRRNVSAGEFVRAAAVGGSTPIVTVVQMSTVRVVTQVPDRDVPKVDIGDPATFRADALPGRQYPGKVSRIAVAEDASKGTMRVEIDLDNADGRLRPGQFGRVQIELESQPDAIAIPTTALGMQADQSRFCFRVVNGRAVRTRITIHEDNEEHTLVEDGLREGDVVVTDAEGITDGQVIPIAPGGRDAGIVSPDRKRR